MSEDDGIGTNVVQSEYAKRIVFNAIFDEKAEEKMNECLYD